MNKVFKVFRYQVYESLAAVAIFYAAMLFVTLLLTVWDGSSSGFEFATAIFIFVVGLNSFKTNFRFMQFLSVTRKTFFLGTLLALVAIAAGMAVIDIAWGRLYAQLQPYSSLFSQAYAQGSIFAQFVWEFALLAMFAFGGLFITALYYRSNRVLKIVISLSPVYISIILNLLQPSVEQMIRIFAFLGGFREGVTVWSNLLGMFVTVLISVGLSFLLIRRAPVKR